MEASYKKDFRHNYLVLPRTENSKGEDYCVQMLQANSVKGIIRPEPRTIDNHVLYYYDITSTQAFEIIYSKSTMNYKQIKRIFSDLADLLEQTDEYLLNENDLILVPEHVYIGLSAEQINVCYLPGYNKDIKNQMTAFIEHILNKVDHKQKDAVLYIYNLYKVCREDGNSFNELLSAIRENNTDTEKGIKIESKENSDLELYEMDKLKPADKGRIKAAQIPVMPEKISDEREKYYYPLITYIYTAACVTGAILMLIISINTKLIYTSLGSRIDYGKLMALLVILLCIAGYLMKNIWNKNNRLTKIISNQEYIDPREDDKAKIQSEDKLGEREAIYDDTLPEKRRRMAEEMADKSNPTVLLNAGIISFGCCLEPENKEMYEPIHIKSFPFVIGKHRNHVDYCFDKEVVSRYHVKITKEEDTYYITDLNSTNGTCLNERPLVCYQRYEITTGDEVAIAGVRYLFQIYG